jgi:hypothetical protein
MLRDGRRGVVQRKGKADLGEEGMEGGDDMGWGDDAVRLLVERQRLCQSFRSTASDWHRKDTPCYDRSLRQASSNSRAPATPYKLTSDRIDRPP